MVELLEPKPTETVGDPACGTGGFLVGVARYLWETYTSPEGIHVDAETGQKIYTGDRLEPHLDHIRKSMFHGFDFDTTMLRRSEEHPSELQSLMRISYAVLCLKQKKILPTST